MWEGKLPSLDLSLEIQTSTQDLGFSLEHMATAQPRNLSLALASRAKSTGQSKSSCLAALQAAVLLAQEAVQASTFSVFLCNAVLICFTLLNCFYSSCILFIDFAQCIFIRISTQRRPHWSIGCRDYVKPRLSAGGSWKGVAVYRGHHWCRNSL